jgi:hypothetical protein
VQVRAIWGDKKWAGGSHTIFFIDEGYHDGHGEERKPM